MNCMFSCFQGKSEAVVRTEYIFMIHFNDDTLGGSFCFMSWCSKYFCAVGALCMFAYFLVKLK